MVEYVTGVPEAMCCAITEQLLFDVDEKVMFALCSVILTVPVGTSRSAATVFSYD
jgi:hypothetical protein